MVLTRFAERLGLLDIVAPRNKKSSQDARSQTSPSCRREEEQRKQQLLENQLERETEARTRKAFVKNQRVRYHNRAMNTYCDAVIVGVHLDDGPDDPYYTISFKKQVPQENDSDNNKSFAKLISVEKQTTPHRLEPLPWDKDATWRILFDKE